MNQELTDWVKETSIASGFTSVGITSAGDHNFSQDLNNFLSKNYHGEMSWLEDRKHWRSSPSTLWPEAKSIVMLAESYPSPKNNTTPDQGEISAYARGRDYHDVVKKRLKKLGRALIEKAGGEIKVFVDTAPVMEKPLAQAAGLGWQGKHGNLLSRELGNWFFIGSIFTTHSLIPDKPMTNHCGSCSSCVEACPTEAFDANGQLDPRKCISYLTIELAGPIPHELRKGMGNRIYGCDICLNACPWNKFEASNVDEKLWHREELISPNLKDLLQLDDASFRQMFSGSPIKRAGWERLMRNCLIAAGNSNDRSLLHIIEPYLSTESQTLAEAAQWAKDQLNG